MSTLHFPFPVCFFARMSSLQVDHNGNRIKTDILTSGYLRGEIETRYEILIPSEIKQLCFDFWLINICDEWDKTMYNDTRVEMDGQTVKMICNKEINFPFHLAETISCTKNGCFGIDGPFVHYFILSVSYSILHKLLHKDNKLLS